jgi:hypothetical protein
LDGRLATAESNLHEVRSAFESFREESSRQSLKSLKKLEEVSGQIRAFQDHSEGKVSGVLNENENLKVRFNGDDCFSLKKTFLHGK